MKYSFTRVSRGATASSPKLLRRMNARVSAGDALRETGAAPGDPELVAVTGLSRPTVDAVVDDLLLGWLAEADEIGPAKRARGRPARALLPSG